jgi:hypothetical protein
MAGVASMAAAINAADRNFGLITIIQLLHLTRKANSVGPSMEMVK